MKNAFQIPGKLVLLILFLFVFFGSNCGRDTTKNNSPNAEQVLNEEQIANVEQILSEQETKVAAAEQASTEAQQRVEAAREAGDAAKVAEVEKKQKKVETEAKKQRQIQSALKIAASGVFRANEAVEQVAAAKAQFNGTYYAKEEPFTHLETMVNKAATKAGRAFAETIAITEVSALYDKGEEVAIAANQAEQQVRLSEEFVSRFQNQFTFHSHEKAIFQRIFDETEGAQNENEQFKEECKNFIKAFTRELEQSLSIEVSQHLPTPDDEPNICNQIGMTRGGLKQYNCFCSYYWDYENTRRKFYRRH